MRTIWYMGAKTRLTDDIVAAVERAAPEAETVLDLMCGTSAVARSLAPHYRVVTNDVQAYASTIAEAYLVHGRGKARRLADLNPARDLGARFCENQAALFDLLAPAVALEDAFLEAYGLEPQSPDAEGGPQSWDQGPSSPAALRQARRRVRRDPAARARAYRAFALTGTPAFREEADTPATGPFRGAQDLFLRQTIAARRRDPHTFPYLLASSFYPNVYLGIRQAIAVDSLRYAIDGLTGWRRTHYLAALLHAASVTTSATSHFCQPRGLVRDPEVKAVLLRRSVSIPSRLVAFSRVIATAVRDTPLRTDNQVRQGDWRAAYEDWDRLRPDVVYVDPPYTADNYSRFYHVLEVLTRYDYPQLQLRGGKTTKGRYPTRADRHQSPFCTRRGVEDELRAVIHETAARGAALVLSYGEENGLLLRGWRDAGASPQEALERFAGLAREAYREVELTKRQLLHSGQGDSNHQVTELLLTARRPRNQASKTQRGKTQRGKTQRGKSQSREPGAREGAP